VPVSIGFLGATTRNLAGWNFCKSLSLLAIIGRALSKWHAKVRQIATYPDTVGTTCAVVARCAHFIGVFKKVTLAPLKMCPFHRGF
jgi:hypothetical protein